MMPSRIEAPLPVEAPERGITGVLDRLQAATLPLVDIEVADTRLVEGSTWEAVARFVLPGGQSLPLRIYDRATMRELFDLHVEFGRLPASVVDEVRACRRSVGVQAEIAGPGPLERYHVQLKVLAWLAPEAPAVLDVSAADARTATWLREVAESEVPPHPNALYTVHVVHDEDDVAWLHTHGLERCGRHELDMVDVPVEIAREMGMLLNATAHLLLDHGDPEAEEVFTPARDMPLVAVPVAEALRGGGRIRNGGLADRDPVHSGPRRVLFAPRRGLWARLTGRRRGSPAVYAPKFEGHPTFYVTSLQTDRMASLAKERFSRFRHVYAQLADHPAFRFLVKLGFETSAGGDDGREHLWFDIHGFVGESEVDATCLNQPFDVAELAEGQRGVWSLGRMTDFSVLSPAGQISPDHIASLEALAAEPEVLDQFREMVQEGL